MQNILASVFFDNILVITFLIITITNFILENKQNIKNFKFKNSLNYIKSNILYSYFFIFVVLIAFICLKIIFSHINFFSPFLGFLIICISIYKTFKFINFFSKKNINKNFFHLMKKKILFLSKSSISSYFQMLFIRSF